MTPADFHSVSADLGDKTQPATLLFADLSREIKRVSGNMFMLLSYTHSANAGGVYLSPLGFAGRHKESYRGRCHQRRGKPAKDIDQHASDMLPHHRPIIRHQHDEH